MRILSSLLAVLLLLAPTSADRDRFAFFRPTVVLSDTDVDTLAQGAPIVRFLQASGHEVGAFTAIAVDPAVTVDRVAAWMR